MIKVANASTSKTDNNNQVRICDYYDKGWDYIIRPNSNIANGLAFYAEKLCNNNNVLYSQEKRLTLNNLLKKNGYDLSCVNERVYCDCSSFVGTCVNGMGILLDVSCFTTSTMRDTLQRKGFNVIKFVSKNQLQKGDILVMEGSHTVIVVEAETKIQKVEKIGRVEINDIKSYLNVREKPSTNSKVIATLKFNDEIKVIGEIDNWYQVSTDTFTGYCYKQYVRC